MQCECVECPNELEKQHEKSPGVVENVELIALILLVPDQWDDSNFTNAAFSRSKLKRGQLSICRVDHTTLCEVKQFVVNPQLSKDPLRSLAGVACANCGDIRAIKTEAGSRAFCIVDYPIIANTSEAAQDTASKSDSVCSCITPHYLGHAHLEFSKEMTGNDNVAVLANIKMQFQKSGCPLPLEDVFNSCEN